MRIGGIVGSIRMGLCRQDATYSLLLELPQWHLTRKVAFALDEGHHFPLCQPEPLRQLFQTTQLGKVEVRSIDVPTTFRDFYYYWSPFLGGQGPASIYAMSLSEERRVALREHIRLTLLMGSDGSIHLITRAWAVYGVRTN